MANFAIMYSKIERPAMRAQQWFAEQMKNSKRLPENIMLSLF